MTSVLAPEAGFSTLFTGPPHYTPISAWGPVSASLLTVAICAVSALAVIGAIAVSMANGMPGSGLDEAGEQMGLASPIGLGAALGAQLLSLGACWWAAGRGGLRRETLALASKGSGWMTFVLAGALVVGLTSVAEFAMYHMTKFDIFADTKVIVEGLRSPLWWGTVFVGVVFAPLWEELTFRGFLLSALAKTRLGIIGGGMISNIAWTALHWGYSWQGLTSVFIAGLIMTWLVWRTGSIRVPIVAHAIANATALSFTYIYSPVG